MDNSPHIEVPMYLAAGLLEVLDGPGGTWLTVSLTLLDRLKPAKLMAMALLDLNIE